MSLLLLFHEALIEVARVGTYGAVKYSRGGWQHVPDGINRYTAAMLRHLCDEQDGIFDQDPYYDTEQGAPWKDTIRHDAQVAWNALARLTLQIRKYNLDDGITTVTWANKQELFGQSEEEDE